MLLHGGFRFPGAALLLALVHCPHAAGNYYEDLGLQDEATELDVQLAYKDLLVKHRPQANQSIEDRLRLAKIQTAYTSLTDGESRDEAMGFVDYWSNVQSLRSDTALQNFAEFSYGGSACLRVIFVTQKQEERVYEAFNTAMRLSGRVRVGQLHWEDAMQHSGNPGSFFSSLKLTSVPAVVLFDPVSRASKVSYDLSRIAVDAERLLSGQLAQSRTGRVQELDDFSFESRCGGDRCDWAMIFATTPAAEKRRTLLAGQVKLFMEACVAIHRQREALEFAMKGSGKETKLAPCFWMRLGRSHEWEEIFRQVQPNPQLSTFIAAWGVASRKIALMDPQAVDAAVEGFNPKAVQSWFQDLALNDDMALAFPSPPALPFPQDSSEDVVDSWVAWATFHAQEVVDCVKSVPCLTGAGPTRVLREVTTWFQTADLDAKCYVAGPLLLSIIVLRALCCRRTGCCGRRRRGTLSEEDAAQQVEPLVQVVLRKSNPDEKFGISIEKTARGGLGVTGISDGGLVAQWNASERLEWRRLRIGDRIVALTRQVNGQPVKSTTSSAMTQGFTSGADEVTLTVSLARPGDEELTQLITSAADPLLTEVQKAITGGDEADGLQLVVSDASPSGYCMEVVRPGKALELRNLQLRQDGACASQIVEVGDCLVFPSCVADLAAKFGQSGKPSALVAKWRPSTEVRKERVQVTIEREEKELLGMQVRQCPWVPAHMEVLNVLDAGAVAAANRKAAASGGPRVLPGDRLVAANGKTGSQAMNQEFRCAKVVLDVERFALQGSMLHSALGSSLTPATTRGSLSSSVPLASAPSPASAAAAAGRERNHTAKSGCGSWLILTSLCALGGTFPLAVAAAAGIVEPPHNLRRFQLEDLVTPLPPGASKYMRQIPPSLWGEVGALLLVIGVLCVFQFLRYEVLMMKRPQDRWVFPQLFVAACAAASLGFSSIFLNSWAGLYV